MFPPSVRATLLLLGAAALTPLGLDAQEIRFGAGWAHSGIENVSSMWGEGIGLRWVGGGGIGVGLGYDRVSGSSTSTECLHTTGSGAESCVSDRFRFATEMDLVTLLGILEAVRTDDWRVRVVAGRTAGSVRGDALGLETGAEVRIPPADRGGPLLAWRRGADGSVLGFELLRRAPGPLPVHLRAAYRGHRIEMSGCELGELFLYCGSAQINELQVGLQMDWPWSRGEPD